ncbi:hypothetical protein LCL61_11125 [Amycolatopsis coloradensis]|uniref:Uncharacterized protein n=1 Tax=Amycolatopsis coloradensis TaxID=76021 RepID=A0ACD5BA31_9PSEU
MAELARPCPYGSPSRQAGKDPFLTAGPRRGDGRKASRRATGPRSRWALDALTGDADQIKAQAETWSNIAKELGAIGTDLTDLVKADLRTWAGDAADRYRERSQDTVTVLTAAQKGCEGASSGVKTAGEVVAAVRTWSATSSPNSSATSSAGHCRCCSPSASA